MYYPIFSWPARFLLNKSTYNHMGGSPVCDESPFFCCFQNSLFYFDFDNLILLCLGVDVFRFNIFGCFWASWIWMSISVPRFRKFLAIITFNKFSASLSFPFLSGTPVMFTVVILMIYRNSHRLSSFIFILFFLSFWLDNFK